MRVQGKNTPEELCQEAYWVGMLTDSLPELYLKCQVATSKTPSLGKFPCVVLPQWHTMENEMSPILYSKNQYLVVQESEQKSILVSIQTACEVLP